MSLINVDLSDTIASWKNKTNQLAANVGDLALLSDSAANIVASINAVQLSLQDLQTQLDSDVARIDTNVTILRSNHDSDIAELSLDVYGATLNLSALTTTDKTSIIAAVNELDRRAIDVYNSAGTLLNS